MVETRNPIMIASAIMLAKHLDLFSGKPASDLGWCKDFFLDQGYTHDESGLRRLVSDSVHHLIFPRNYFDGMWRPPQPVWDESNWPLSPKRAHPTWSLEPKPNLPAMRFGGFAEIARCSGCGDRLHRIINLDPVPEGLGISGFNRLEIATCLSCLRCSRSVEYYQHNASGRVSALAENFWPKSSKSPVEPLREGEVRLAASPRRWYWQEWMQQQGEENMNRVGGEPCWTTIPVYPNCQNCDAVMRFVMQLDSFLPLADGREWWWDERGVGYVFWCDRCKVSGFRVEDNS